jgi:malate dehydrogenase (oxaloacetate-decarboxylating)(NADP+)
VSAHFSRFKVTEISLQAQALGQFDDSKILAAAELLADAKVDVIGWSGTSSGWLGFDADHRLCERIRERTGIRATTAVLALNELLALRGRKGVTPTNAAALVSRRINFGMMMVRRGDADGLVAGLTTPYPETVRPALQILGLRPGCRRVTGMYMMLLKNDVKFFADPVVNIDPDAYALADIAIQVADAVAAFEIVPRVAMISFSNFGSAPHPQSRKVAEAVDIVRQLRPDLEIDGELQADIAVDGDKLREQFPFSRLKEAANVLVFPTLDAANAAYKVLSALGGADAIGPMLLGLDKPVAVLPRDANVDTIVAMTAYAAARVATE